MLPAQAVLSSSDTSARTCVSESSADTIESAPAVLVASPVGTPRGAEGPAGAGDGRGEVVRMADTDIEWLETVRTGLLPLRPRPQGSFAAAVASEMRHGVGRAGLVAVVAASTAGIIELLLSFASVVIDGASLLNVALFSLISLGVVFGVNSLWTSLGHRSLVRIRAAVVIFLFLFALWLWRFLMSWRFQVVECDKVQRDERTGDKAHSDADVTFCTTAYGSFVIVCSILTTICSLVVMSSLEVFRSRLLALIHLEQAILFGASIENIDLSFARTEEMRRQIVRAITMARSQVAPMVLQRAPLLQLSTDDDDEGYLQGADAEAVPTPTPAPECIVCFDAQQNTVLLDCGHSATCLDCARQVSLCPLCRAPILGMVVRPAVMAADELSSDSGSGAASRSPPPVTQLAALPCRVCSACARRESINLPCGHRTYCHACAADVRNQIQHGAARQCPRPSCGRDLARIVDLYD
ncbi:uncharacterized protein AMSG_07823 [Thecamonas trahens ATCC 50062]|uniref:RING-type domain-containing protein n=1 Tax=Thecamonas trahens ATCC 50062 TaxID=461836 RepID=A0A0L0DK63_THETB|nr:hypothetical protein AMSG_07823 [Thecamonas trahens ATCC 50062]KNC51753.1 hypothetical protein AMSG_07823 [Thecamonas trahens ATCC 50062]|eukprot:XP_013755881.1 hypothetical protein AMSG_07823 [Thecamonas trahens ATCC 50062]